MLRKDFVQFSGDVSCKEPNQAALPEEAEAMIPIRDLFEGHLTVSNLQRSMAFYGDKLGLELAQTVPERAAAFYWIGGRGSTMLGLWEVARLRSGSACTWHSRWISPTCCKRHKIFGPLRSSPSTFTEIQRRNRLFSPGCRRLLCIFMIRTGIYLNFYPCCPMPRSRNWELWAGPAGHNEILRPIRIVLDPA